MKKRHTTVRIPRKKRARVSARVRKLVAEGYSPSYAARKAYHGRDCSRDCVGIHTHENLGARMVEQAVRAKRDPGRLSKTALAALDSIAQHHLLTPRQWDAAHDELIPGGYIDARGTWKLTPKGRRALGGSSRDHSSGERLYRVVWIRDDKGTRGVLFPGPLTHREAMTVVRKTTKYPWRRLMIEEIHGHASRDPHHLTAAERRRLRPSELALPARRALPIEDARHVRAAASRLEQMRRRGTITLSEYRSARSKIHAAAKRLGVHLSF